MSSLSYHSPKTVVKESQIHGRGLFAREPIAKGEIVAIKGGYIFDAAILRDVEQSLGPAQITIAEGFFIRPLGQTEREGGMIFSNHSCDPNIGVQGQIVFVAMREFVGGFVRISDYLKKISINPSKIAKSVDVEQVRQSLPRF